MRWSSIKPDWLIRRQAADLLVRADADPSPENRQRLERWRAADPRQEAALAKAEAVLGMSAFLKQPAVPAGGDGQRPARWSPGLAIAASIVAATIVLPAAFLLLAGPSGGGRLEAAMLRTGPGETREAKLADGTAVILGSSTAVRVDVSNGKREARVEHGRATFKIARDPRPFRVSAGQRSALVEEGVVEVVETPEDRHMRLIEGHAAVLGMAGNVRAPALVSDLPRRPRERATDAQARLSFDNVRLAELIAWANGADAQPIVLGDSTVGALRVTGVYSRGDSAALASSLASAFRLRLSARADGTIELGPSLKQ